MITGEQVKEAMKANNITFVEHHNCSLCGYMTNYFVDDDELFFDPGCDCRHSYPERRDFQSAADWINMQTNPEIKAKIAARFGIEV